MKHIFRLCIGGVPISRLPDKDVLPYWFLVQLYTPKVTDRPHLESVLKMARWHYSRAEELWVLAVLMFLSGALALSARALGVTIDAELLHLYMIAMSVSVVPMFGCLILILPDKQLWTMVDLHIALKAMPQPIEAGILGLRALTEEEFEDRVDTALNTLSALCEQYQDTSAGWQLRRTKEQLEKLLELSVELDFLSHRTEEYWRLKRAVSTQ
jgi:hypothetical protein